MTTDERREQMEFEATELVRISDGKAGLIAPRTPVPACSPEVSLYRAVSTAFWTLRRRGKTTDEALTQMREWLIAWLD